MRGKSDRQAVLFVASIDLESRVRANQQAHVAAAAFNLVRMRSLATA